MRFEKTIILKNGKKCLLRTAVGDDAKEVLDHFNLTHAQTDFLLSYPDENSFDAERERQFLTNKENSADEIEILAVVDGRIVGTAGIDSLGQQEKIRHRAEFGVAVEKTFWNLGIGRALTLACIDSARSAGYAQLELSVVSENQSAILLYKKLGFALYGRNPRGFRSRVSGWQELVLMRLELDGVEH